MKISTFSHIHSIINKNGVGFVIRSGGVYMSTYIINFLLTPFIWLRLQNLPDHMSANDVLHFVEVGCNGIFRPLQIHSEIYSLLKYVKGLKPKVLVEIGTANGGTLLALSKVSSKNASIISIDLPAGNFGGGYAWYKIPLFHAFVSNNQKLYLLRLNSHEDSTRNELEKILDGRKIDFLLIDGDHTYEGVKQDYKLYSPLVREGGSIAFHDIVKHRSELNCKVDLFWNQIKLKYKHTTYVENWQQGLCGIGVLTV